MKEVVRNMKSNATHLAEFDRTIAAVMFGAAYRMPPTDTVAYCGVRIKDGVVMRPGTKVKCNACRHLEQHVEDVKDAADPISLQEQTVRRVIEQQLGYTLLPGARDDLANALISALREIE
jgi:hypothetical protein